MLRPPALLLVVALLLGSSSLGPHSAHACSTIIVGRRASADGSIYIARTDDTSNVRCLLLPGGCTVCSAHWSVCMQGCRGADSFPGAVCQPAAARLLQAIITNNLLYHSAREGPAVFRGSINNFTMLLPGPALAYTAVPKFYGWATWPQARRRRAAAACRAAVRCGHAAAAAAAACRATTVPLGATPARRRLASTARAWRSATQVRLPVVMAGLRQGTRRRARMAPPSARPAPARQRPPTRAWPAQRRFSTTPRP